jgi:hypothetical protein
MAASYSASPEVFGPQPLWRGSCSPAVETIPEQRTAREVEIIETLPSWQSDDLASPFLLVPGWGEGICEDAAQMLADSLNSPVYGFEHFRCTEARSAPHEYKTTTSRAAYDKVIQKGKGPVTLIARSEGAIPAVGMLSQLDDERLSEVGGLILQAPAGLIGADNYLKLSFRTEQEIAQGWMTGTIRRLGVKALCDTGIYALKDVALSLKETRAIAGTDLRPGVEELLDRGLPVGVVACGYDRIFPALRMNQMTSELQAKGLRFALVDGVSHLEFADPKIVQAIKSLRQELLELAV